MPSPESSPGLSPVSIAEIRKRSRERFATVPTHIPGVSLRAEPDVEVDILKKTVEVLRDFGLIFYQDKVKLNALEEEQSERRLVIISVAEAHEGLRGIQSKADNFKLTVFPKKINVRWDESVLKQGLGVAYHSVVAEDLKCTLTIPLGVLTREGEAFSIEKVIDAVKEAVMNLGVPQEDLDKMISVNIERRVDEEKLEKMEEEGQVTLPPEAKSFDISWTVTADQLRATPPES